MNGDDEDDQDEIASPSSESMQAPSPQQQEEIPPFLQQPAQQQEEIPPFLQQQAGQPKEEVPPFLQQQQAEEPSGLGSVARGFLHGVLPTAAAVATGAGVGTLIGGPVGAVVGAGAGLLAGAGAGYGQEKLIEQVAPQEAQAYRRAQEAHPYLTGAGEIAAAGPYFGVRTAGTVGQQITRRALAGAAGVGIDAAQQVALQGQLDPLKSLEAGAGMALLAGRPTRLGRALGLPAEPIESAARPAAETAPSPTEPLALPAPATRYGEGFTMNEARPEYPGAEAKTETDAQVEKANPAAVRSVGTASEATPADTGQPPVTNERAREDPQGSAKGPEDYGKKPAPRGQGGGVNVGPDPAVRAALEATTPAQERLPQDPVALRAMANSLRRDGNEARAKFLEDTAAAMETAQRRPVPTPPDVARPRRQIDESKLSLLSFLAHRGGLRPDPELNVIFGGKNPFIPGFGRLIRQGGMSLDRAREAALEGRYMFDVAADQGRPPESTINQLLELVDAESRGRRQYSAGQEARGVKPEDAGQRMHEIESRAAQELDTHPSIDPQLRQAFHNRMVEILDREGETSAEHALERALIEHEDATGVTARHEAVGPLPGWDVDDTGAAFEGGRRAPAEAPGPSEPSPFPRAETTAAGEQAILPGAEPSARQLAAAREAEGRGRATTKAEQTEPGPLFAPGETQESLLAAFQQAQQIQPEGKPAIARPPNRAQQQQQEQPTPPGLKAALAKRYQSVSDEALAAAAKRPDLPPGHAEAIAAETARRAAQPVAGAPTPGAPPPPRGPAGPTPLGGHPPGQGPPPPPSGPAGLAGKIAERVPALSKIKRAFQETFDPGSISDDARKAEAHIAQYASARAGDRDRIIRNSLEGEKFWNKIPDEDRLDFMHAVETGQPVKPEYQEHADRYRQALDEADKAEKLLGSKAAYREDYFPHAWERPPQGKPPLMDYLKQTLGPSNFQKARTFDLIQQGLAAGYKLKSTNPEILVRDRLLAGADMRQRMELLNRMRDEGLATKVKDEANSKILARQGWQAINAPDREQWMIAPDAQPVWKNGVAARGFWSDQGLMGDAFRGWMGFKSAWIPVRLALSAFHPLHVAHINMSSNLARAADQVVAGHFEDALKSLGQAFKPYSSLGKDARAQWLLGENARTPWGKEAVQTMEEGGFAPMMSEQLRIDAGQKLSEAWARMSPFGLAYQTPRWLIQKVQAPIFEHWIPQLKTAAYLNDAAALMKRRPDLANDPAARKVALSAIAKSVDNRFGEMFYDRLFWNRYVKDAGIGSFLSLGWNLGFLREFGGAAMEAALRPAETAGLRKPSELLQVQRDATNKIKFASIYMGTAAFFGGLMTYAFTGKPPQDANDFIFPRVGGTNPDGSPRRLTTMFYLREVPMLEKHIQEHGGGVGGTLAGAKDMIYSKMLFEPFMELYRNRSYFGSEIYDENAPGYKQLMQAGQHILTQQLSPMSVTGAQRASETGGGVGEQALSYLGFGPAPAYAERSALQNRIGYLYNRFVAPEAKPYEDEADTKAKQTARTQILMAKQSKDQGRINDAVKAGRAAGLSPQYIGQIGRPGFDTDQRMFKRLPQQEQMAVLNQANSDEVKRYLPHASSKTKVQWRKEHPQQIGAQ